MSDFDKNMENLFNVTPQKTSRDIVPVKKPSSTEEKVDLSQDLVDAYEQSKENLQDLIDQGKSAMEDILDIARAGQHPRAFEVYGTLLKNVVDANKELLSIQKQMRDMDKKTETNKTNIDKAIFVGSTAELSKFLKNNQGGENT